MAVAATALHAQSMTVDTISPALRTRIDGIAEDVLKLRGVPSASVAVVQGGKLVYTHAYGKAHLDPDVAATPEMRYSIGSVSKQFTAAAILMRHLRGPLLVLFLLLAALNPYVVDMMSIARGYGLGIALTTAGAYCLLRDAEIEAPPRAF